MFVQKVLCRHFIHVREEIKMFIGNCDIKMQRISDSLVTFFMRMILVNPRKSSSNKIMYFFLQCIEASIDNRNLLKVSNFYNLVGFNSVK